MPTRLESQMTLTELICSLCKDTFTAANDAEAADALAKQQALGEDEYWIVCPKYDNESQQNTNIRN